MNGADFRTGAPPRWSEAIDGIVWLPRFAAKARAYDAGTLGSYLLGQSPVDDEFLQAAGLTYAEFIAIVRSQPDDASVLAAIASATPGALDRLRLFSLEMPVRRRVHMRVLDFDDGYDRPAWLAAPHAIGNALFAPLAALIRKVRPLNV